MINAEPELTERELGKQHQLTESLRTELIALGAAPFSAALASSVAMAVFRVTYGTWLRDDDRMPLADRLDRAVAEVHPMSSASS